MYNGSESEAQKRHYSYSRERFQSRDKRPRSGSRNRYEPRRMYEEIDQDMTDSRLQREEES